MLVYTILLFILIFGVFHFDYRQKKVLQGGYYFFVFLYCTLMAGLRYRVGGDALAYEDYFSSYPDLNSYFYFLSHDNEYFGYQPLYVLFVAACKSIDPDYYFYQLMHSIVFNIVLFWFIKKYASRPFTTILILYIFMLYFYFGYEIQREMFAISCFLIAYKYFMKNKWIPYYLICTVGFFFHISATFLFILPLFKLIQFSKRNLIILVIISVPLLFSKFIFTDLIKVLLVTESMQSKGEKYSEIEFSVVGILFFYVVRFVVFIPFLYFYAKNKVKDNKYNWMFFTLTIMAILSQVMVGFDRLSNYIYIPFVIYVVDMLYDRSTEFSFRNKYQRNTIVLSLYLFLFSIIGVKFFVANIDNKYFYYSVYFPYGSVEDKVKSPERERFIYEMWRN
ncbi:hypothetical protein D3C87_1043660 [compost metagenome]